MIQSCPVSLTMNYSFLSEIEEFVRLNCWLSAVSTVCIVPQSLGWNLKGYTFTGIRQIISQKPSHVDDTNSTGRYWNTFLSLNTTCPVMCGIVSSLTLSLFEFSPLIGLCVTKAALVRFFTFTQQTKTTVHICWSPTFLFHTNKDQIDNKHSRWCLCQDLKFHKSPIKLWETLRCSTGGLCAGLRATISRLRFSDNCT